MADRAVLTGRHFMMGNIACAEGALAAGCRFAAGYPITPATEVAERLAERLPADGRDLPADGGRDRLHRRHHRRLLGRHEVHDRHLGSRHQPDAGEHRLRASAPRPPASSSTSCAAARPPASPPWSCQGDMVQVATRLPRRLPDHRPGPLLGAGDASTTPSRPSTWPSSSGRRSSSWPTPSSATCGRSWSSPSRTRSPSWTGSVPERAWTSRACPGFLDEDVAPMPVFGEGHKAHVTSSCHDAYGRRNVIDASALDVFIKKLNDKIDKHRDEIVRVRRTSTAPTSSWSPTAPSSAAPRPPWRRAGPRGSSWAGSSWEPSGRSRTRRSRPWRERAKHLLVLENNLGQIFPYVQAAAAGCHGQLPSAAGPRRDARDRGCPGGGERGAAHEHGGVQPSAGQVHPALGQEHGQLSRVRQRHPGPGHPAGDRRAGTHHGRLRLRLGHRLLGLDSQPRFFADVLHTTHGRPIAFATGVKAACPDKHVMVVSGDGDLTAIGGNHLIHAARRNIDMTVICVNNGIYGMTGGQVAPTTPLGLTTITTPYGNAENPFDISRLVEGAGASFVARWTTYHPRQIVKTDQEGDPEEGLRLHRGHLPVPGAVRPQDRHGQLGADDGALQAELGEPSPRPRR